MINWSKIEGELAANIGLKEMIEKRISVEESNLHLSIVTTFIVDFALKIDQLSLKGVKPVLKIQLFEGFGPDEVNMMLEFVDDQNNTVLASKFSSNPVYKDNTEALLDIKSFLRNKTKGLKIESYNPKRESLISIELTKDSNKNKEILFDKLLDHNQKLLLSKLSLEVDLAEKKNQCKRIGRKI